jgi:putative endonuclease
LGAASICILVCSDGSYYTGITRRSVEERVSEHAQGLMPGYTFTRRPVKLIFSERDEWIVDAIAAERRIKSWSRAKKEAYMRGDFSALVALSKRGSKKGSLRLAADLRPHSLVLGSDTKCRFSKRRFQKRQRSRPLDCRAHAGIVLRGRFAPGRFAAPQDEASGGSPTRLLHPRLR